MKAGYIYILHFLKPYRHARHYIGYSETPRRLYEHFTGKYSSREPKLMRAAREFGVEFVLAKSIAGDRKLERKIKNVGHSEYYCPICKLDREIIRLQSKAQNDLFADEICKIIEAKQSQYLALIEEMKQHAEFLKQKGARKLKNVA